MNDKELKVFESPEFGKLTVVEKNGEPFDAENKGVKEESHITLACGSTFVNISTDEIAVISDEFTISQGDLKRKKV